MGLDADTPITHFLPAPSQNLVGPLTLHMFKVTFPL